MTLMMSCTEWTALTTFLISHKQVTQGSSNGNRPFVRSLSITQGIPGASNAAYSVLCNSVKGNTAGTCGQFHGIIVHSRLVRGTAYPSGVTLSHEYSYYLSTPNPEAICRPPGEDRGFGDDHRGKRPR